MSYSLGPPNNQFLYSRQSESNKNESFSPQRNGLFLKLVLANLTPDKA